MVVGIVAIGLPTAVQNWDVGVLTTLAVCIGASAVAPALTYSLFWRGFTRTGLLATLYGGAASALLLMVFSKAVSGTPSAVFPNADFDLFPMQTTGLVSIPFGYLAGWLGSRLTTGAAPPTAVSTGACTRRARHGCSPQPNDHGGGGPLQGPSVGRDLRRSDGRGGQRLFGPHGLALPGVAGTPAFGHLGHQEQAPPALVGRTGAAQVR